MSAIRVSRTEINPTHDISLTDGTKTIGLHLIDPRGTKDRRAMRQVSTPRTSLQIQQGDPQYSTYELPYTPLTQKDWSGGRGAAYFDQDTTKYYDAQGIDTRFGYACLAPRVTACPTASITQDTTAGQASTNITQAATTRIATDFVSNTTAVIRKVTISPPNDYPNISGNLEIYSDSSGAPGTLLYTYTNAYQGLVINAKPGIYYTNFPVYAGGRYWFVFVTTGQWGTAYMSAAASRLVLSKAAGGWVTEQTNKTLAYTAQTGGADARWLFFEYRAGMYAVENAYEAGTSPRLLLNGYRALATQGTNAGSPNLYTTLWFGLNDLAGKIVKIVAGPGVEETKNWRVLNGNTAGPNSILTTAEPWLAAHTTATEFVILGTDAWTEIIDHGITKPVTDVLVVNDVVYFAQGDDTPIRRGRLLNTVWSWANDGTNAATFLKLIADTTGKNQVWKFKATTSGVMQADTQLWATDLIFGLYKGGVFTAGSEIIAGNPQYKITGATGYGTPMVPWLVKENEFGSISNGIYAQVPIAELAAARGEDNGRAITAAGVYLYFSLMQGFERFYDSRLDDMGPNRAEGFPPGRQGPITSAIPYPGGIIVTVNGGTLGQSSILFFNDLGWHELYRGATGQRMSAVYVQVIPGDTIDRLWFHEGAAIKYMPITINPRQALNYQYTATGSLTTATFTGNYREIIKYLDSVQIFTNNLLPGHRTITVYYQADSEIGSATWHALPASYDTSPNQKISFTSNHSAKAQRWRLKIQFDSDSAMTSPELIAFTMNIVTRVPPAKQWGLTFQADDVAVSDANGEMDTPDMFALLDALETWSNSDTQPTPLYMRSVIPKFDDKWVFIDSPNVTPREVSLYDDHRNVKAIGSLNITEA